LKVHLFLSRSNTGFVNLYGSESFSSDGFNLNANPKPVKTIGNLTTAISTLRFNHDAQILAVASKEKKDSMRMVSWLFSPYHNTSC
jgi:U3 small nucleolar RNA-associated protein 18